VAEAVAQLSHALISGACGALALAVCGALAASLLKGL
jgi:hypothetical protein